MIFQKSTLADTAGAATAWLGIAGPATIHVWNGHSGDTYRVWGTLEDGPAVGTFTNAIEIATAATSATKAIFRIAEFHGKISVELDAKSGSPTSGLRQVRIHAEPED